MSKQPENFLARKVTWDLSPLLPELDIAAPFETQFEALHELCSEHEASIMKAQAAIGRHAGKKTPAKVDGKQVLDALDEAHRTQSFLVRAHHYLTLVETTHLGDEAASDFCEQSRATLENLELHKNIAVLSTDGITKKTAAALFQSSPELKEKYSDYFDSGAAIAAKTAAYSEAVPEYPLTGEHHPRDIFFTLQKQPDSAHENPQLHDIAAEGVHKNFVITRKKAILQTGVAGDTFETLCDVNGIPQSAIRSLLDSPIEGSPIALDEKDFPLPRYGWEEACDIVVSAFSDFNPELGLAAQEIISKGWIDARPGQHKFASGSSFQPVSPELMENAPAYVCINFENDLSSVRQLAHELGHASAYLLASRAGSKLTPNQAVNESFSQLAEILVEDALVKRANDPLEKLGLAASNMRAMWNKSRSYQVFSGGTERIAKAFDACRSERPLVAEEINGALRESIRASMGDGVADIQEDAHLRNYWYHREQPFLDAAYDVSYLASLGAVSQHMRDYRNASPDAQERMGEEWVAAIKRQPSGWQDLTQSVDIEPPGDSSPLQYHARQLRNLAEDMGVLELFNGKLDYLDKKISKPELSHVEKLERSRAQKPERER